MKQHINGTELIVEDSLENSKLILKIINNETGEIKASYYPLLSFRDSAYIQDIKNFEFHLFNNINCVENDIRILRINHQRIGWVFPIVSLESTEHSYAKDNNYLDFAYMSIVYLLCSLKTRNLEDNICLSTIFGDNTQIVALYKPWTNGIENFDFNNYSLSLLQYGYCEEGNIKTDSQIIVKIIELKSVSKNNEDVLRFSDLVLKKMYPLAVTEYDRFIILYQTIEILISKIFEVKFIELRCDLETTNDLHKYKEKIDDISKEKYRINLLFSNYSTVPIDYRDKLTNACNDFLHYNEFDNEESVQLALYKVRNRIVHSLYLLKSDYEVLLEKVNNRLLDAIVCIMITLNIH